MEIKSDAKLLRIFVGDSDKVNGVPIYEYIVLQAKKIGLAGATVFKGFMGYGQSSRLHTTKILRLSEDLPIIIEIVDEKEKIDQFLPALDEIFEKANCGGLVTIEKAEVIKYQGRKK